jgi:hypothetical protein
VDLALARDAYPGDAQTEYRRPVQRELSARTSIRPGDARRTIPGLVCQ